MGYGTLNVIFTEATWPIGGVADLGLASPWFDEDIQPPELTEPEIDNSVAFLASLRNSVGMSQYCIQGKLAAQGHGTRFRPKPTPANAASFLTVVAYKLTSVFLLQCMSPEVAHFDVRDAATSCLKLRDERT
jgi:hypothetical protein